MYELLYDDGSHGGPYPTLKDAVDKAVRLVEGAPWSNIHVIIQDRGTGEHITMLNRSVIHGAPPLSQAGLTFSRRNIAGLIGWTAYLLTNADLAIISLALDKAFNNSAAWSVVVEAAADIVSEKEVLKNHGKKLESTG